MESRFCSNCMELFPIEELSSVGGGLLCWECLHDYSKSEEAWKLYGEKYIQEYEDEFLPMFFRSDFLTPEQRLKYMKACWEDFKRDFPDLAREAGEDFLRTAPSDFEVFIKTHQI